ncbi:uncharacterized protein LOC123691978 [Colias croceus]|uniref:uncharacterized protein LOC123691978 n=1 Tax=Colias crocea TaxID=72248 RepID=UPI001E27E1B0|nr:uncharacterized protein LOC123691978 [Colias croceus]
MGITVIEIIATILLNLIHCTNTEHILSCNTSSLEPCPGKNEVCKYDQCVCPDDLVREGEDCLFPTPDSAASHDVTAAIVSIFTIALVIVGLVLVIRKYNLIEYVRQKIDLRRNNDVMYEDVMIGQDDPPLSP